MRFYPGKHPFFDETAYAVKASALTLQRVFEEHYLQQRWFNRCRELVAARKPQPTLSIQTIYALWQK